MNDNDGKKTLGVRGPGARPGNVKQSFSHGRTKNVVVETKRKRVVVPKPAAGKAAAGGAAPNPALKIDSVRDRLYRGRCSTNDFLPRSFDVFMQRRQEITDLVNKQEELGTRSREDLLRFIDGFYRTISSERRTEREIVRRCR